MIKSEKKKEKRMESFIMNGFSILMLVFGVVILLVGFYMYSGKELKIISWKAAFKGFNKNGWKNVGKWTMIVSILPFILAILGIVFHFE